MPSVLFVCVQNSCRSQMAEAFARSMTQGAWRVASAGSRPSGRVHPTAIALMQELGLDLRSHASKGVDAVAGETWDYVVTMGCGDACPRVPARRRLDWPIPDPVGLPLDEARRIRDDLASRVRALVTRPASPSPEPAAP